MVAWHRKSDKPQPIMTWLTDAYMGSFNELMYIEYFHLLYYAYPYTSSIYIIS